MLLLLLLLHVSDYSCLEDDLWWTVESHQHLHEDHQVSSGAQHQGCYRCC